MPATELDKASYGRIPHGVLFRASDSKMLYVDQGYYFPSEPIYNMPAERKEVFDRLIGRLMSFYENEPASDNFELEI